MNTTPVQLLLNWLRISSAKLILFLNIVYDLFLSCPLNSWWKLINVNILRFITTIFLRLRVLRLLHGSSPFVFLNFQSAALFRFAITTIVLLSHCSPLIISNFCSAADMAFAVFNHSFCSNMSYRPFSLCYLVFLL